MLHLTVHCNGLPTLRSKCNVGLLPLTAFTVRTCTGSPYRCFTPGVTPRDDSCGSGALQLVSRVRGTVAVVRFGLRTTTVQHRPRFSVSDHLLLRRVSFGQGMFRLSKGSCRVHSYLFPAVSPRGPCRLARRRRRVMRGLRGSFAKDRGLHGRVGYVFHCKYVCGMYGSGLLFRTSVPVGTSKALGRMSVLKGGCGKRTLLGHMNRLVHATCFTRRSGPRGTFTESFV